MDADLKLLSEQLDELIDWQRKLKSAYTVQVLLAAKVQITRLRASQFRWIPVSERLPERKDADKHQCVFVTAGGRSPITYQYEFLGTSEYTHWAPIPPLPEKSQEEKDEELWWKHVCSTDRGKITAYSREAFLAGLKAARAEKP